MHALQLLHSKLAVLLHLFRGVMLGRGTGAPKLGFDEGEHPVLPFRLRLRMSFRFVGESREFNRAVRGQLLQQTPLQVRMR